MLRDLFLALWDTGNSKELKLQALGFLQSKSRPEPRNKSNRGTTEPRAEATEHSQNSLLGNTERAGVRRGFSVLIVNRRVTIEVDNPLEQLGRLAPYKPTNSDHLAAEPATLPLLHRKTLESIIEDALSSFETTRHVNTSELVDRMARNKHIDPLPRLQRLQSGQAYWLLIDELYGLKCDLDYLWELVSRLPLELRPDKKIRLASTPWPGWFGEKKFIQSLDCIPEFKVGQQVLLIGDRYNPGDALRQLLLKGQSRRVKFVWLSPAYTRRDYYLDAVRPSLPTHAATQAMLIWFSIFPYFTRAMVRDIRRSLGGELAAEVAFWKHEDVNEATRYCEKGEISCNTGEYNLALQQWYERAPEKILSLWQLMRSHIQAKPQWYQQMATLKLPVGMVGGETLKQSEASIARLVADLSSIEKKANQQLLASRVLSFGKALAKPPGKLLQAAIGVAQEHWVAIDPAAAADVGLAQHAMRGEVSGAMFRPSVDGFELAGNISKQPLLEFRMKGGHLFEDNGKLKRCMYSGDVLAYEAGTIHTADERIEFSILDAIRFHWAETLTQDAEGLTLTTQQGVKLTYPSESVNERVPVIDTTNAPSWLANATLKIDDHGLCATLNMFGQEVIMRWIPPGHFQMGSPADEEGRLDGETQHEVILTDGYWLAATCCTQALWSAVMNDNPARFKGENKPVETVSWHDVQDFLNKVNSPHPDLNLSLPTEAQWEYACRAGTDTAYSVGGEITGSQANYFDGPEDAEFAERLKGSTVDVAIYTANPWGLYDMHGNVLEWCEDWYGSYESDPQVNPQGPNESERRVLRGGSWFSNARICRSANRDGSGPSLRDNCFGFRFAQADQPAKRQPVEAQEVAKQARRSRKSRAAADADLKSGTSSSRSKRS